MLELDWIRHAESQMNREGILYICGRSNSTPLSPEGREQAETLAAYLLEQDGPDHVFASSAVRTRQTAEIVCRRIKFPLDQMVLSNDIWEQYQGTWEGRERRLVHTRDTLKELNQQCPHFKGHGGESQQEVEDRIAGWVEERVLPLDSRDKVRVLVFGHGFAIKCWDHYVKGGDAKRVYLKPLANTGICRYHFKEGYWKPVIWNFSPHI